MPWKNAFLDIENQVRESYDEAQERLVAEFEMKKIELALTCGTDHPTDRVEHVVGTVRAVCRTAAVI